MPVENGVAQVDRRLETLARATDRLVDLAQHQQEKIRDLEARSEQELAMIAIQQCYRHVFYPSRNRIGARGVDLTHTAIDIPSASNQPGAGQQQVARALRDLKKLRLPEDQPDAPAYVRDRTPLRKGQMTTLALRDEFRRDPSLPMLLGDDIFIRGIRRGIEQGDYVYQRGDLLFGPGDPPADIRDEQAVVMTMAYAKNKGVWPRRAAKPPPPGPIPRADPTRAGPTAGAGHRSDADRIRTRSGATGTRYDAAETRHRSAATATGRRVPCPGGIVPFVVELREWRTPCFRSESSISTPR